MLIFSLNPDSVSHCQVKRTYHLIEWIVLLSDHILRYAHLNVPKSVFLLALSTLFLIRFPLLEFISILYFSLNDSKELTKTIDHLFKTLVKMTKLLCPNSFRSGY